MREIDQYDYQLIKTFKSKYQTPVLLNRLKKIWAERCGFDVEFVDVHDIAEHLLDLARELGLFNNSYQFKEFIFDLRPEANWKYLCESRSYLAADTKDFNLILLSRLDSLFSLTKVINLPGYEKFNKKSVDKPNPLILYSIYDNTRTDRKTQTVSR